MRTLLLAFVMCLLPFTARAHCDALDGPVVSAAKAALSSGDPKSALAWVRAENEAEVLRAFERTRAVRGTSRAVRELADTWFFETVVRLHRAAEGEPYTGLEPAGSIEPPIAALDRAIATERIEGLERVLDETMRETLHEKFDRAIDAKRQASEDVVAARLYADAYIDLVRFVESITAESHGTVHESSIPGF